MHLSLHPSSASMVSPSSHLVSCMEFCWPCCPMAVDGRRAASLGARQRLRPLRDLLWKVMAVLKNVGCLGIPIKLQFEWGNDEQPLDGWAKIRNWRGWVSSTKNLPILNHWGGEITAPKAHPSFLMLRPWVSRNHLNTWRVFLVAQLRYPLSPCFWAKSPQLSHGCW